MARHPRTGISCEARERRIRPVMEPPASELVAVDPRHLVFPSRVLLHRQTYDAYRRLKTAAEGDGIPATILRIVSGYRSVEQQRRLWTDALRRYGSAEAARRWVMPPGASPRHSGRAIDFWLGRPNSSANIPALRGTPAYAWLVCNAIQFGFFPHAREPWLWEFNPTAPGPPTRT